VGERGAGHGVDGLGEVQDLVGQLEQLLVLLLFFLDDLPLVVGQDLAFLIGPVLADHHKGRQKDRLQPPTPPTDELSPSELRVLRYLPTNLSRPEIAGELSVSVNTVNTHIRNVYTKLQARDRSSAVQRARELRLLSTGRTR
jgi:DNA-binding CsgD family transcriptional regulator